ncbi:MAG TPA: IS110 family transposase, partial [Candidatus Babeliaceae bacterium]|nr:IS110 family transposase [Candidatus Babeliaceae bacterium]
MNQTAQASNDTATTGILYMAMELSQTKWHLAFGNGLKVRQVVIDANNTVALEDEIEKAKEKLRLPWEAVVISCYEAGRDGFWIHRYLEKNGIKNHVIDSSSIKVNRKSRRAKTDRLDAERLLKQLIDHIRGVDKLQTARVPSEAEEDKRRMHRERERLKKERTGHTNRIKSLLNLQGIKCKGKKVWKDYLDKVIDWKGDFLPVFLKEELLRETDRLEMVDKQLKELESRMMERLKTSKDPEFQKIQQLMNLKGIGEVSSWVLIMEWFGWRQFKNRREVGAAAGLVGTPYDSGESQREQGITKAGNKRIRALMIELGWGWLRYQPNSDLSQWFDKRFNHGKRSRKVGIVALARRLLIAIWRYV